MTARLQVSEALEIAQRAAGDRALVELAKGGTVWAREMLVGALLPALAIAARVAAPQDSSTLETDDLLQESVLALYEALECPCLDHDFETCMREWIGHRVALMLGEQAEIDNLRAPLRAARRVRAPIPLEVRRAYAAL